MKKEVEEEVDIQTWDKPKSFRLKISSIWQGTRMKKTPSILLGIAFPLHSASRHKEKREPHFLLLEETKSRGL